MLFFLLLTIRFIYFCIDLFLSREWLAELHVEVPEVVALPLIDEEAGSLVDLLQEVNLVADVHLDDLDVRATVFRLQVLLQL